MQTMSKYTMTLSKVCDALTNVERLQRNYNLTRDEIISIARQKIFDFDYEFYSDTDEEEEKKKALETGIINHFFFDEIGQETYEYWHFELRHWMIVNMPRYYSLFKTIPFQDQENPTWNTSYDEEYTRGTTGRSKASGKDKATNLTSATPQGRIDLESTGYVDSIAQSISEPNSQTDSEGTETYKFHRSGNIGVQTLAQVLQGSRDAIITIEKSLYYEMMDYGLFYQLF